MANNCIYLQLTHDDYKNIEKQMKEFKETTHISVDGFYHKSIRIKINETLTLEFHGNIVKG